jgi:sporulation protein YtfJ
MNIWSCAKHPLRRLLKGFHISDVYIDFLIADEDAYKCALKYGRISGTVYIMLAHLANIFTVRYKTVDINAGFAKKKSRWDAGCNIYFLPFTAVFAALWFLAVYFFRIYLPRKRKSKKICRKAENSAARRNVRSDMENNTKSKVSDLMGISMEKIKEMTDVDSIIGEPIKLEDGTTIIPVSKVSYGFASGGSDLPSKSEKNLFGGGAGAGVSIKPEGFLVVSGGNAKMVSVNSSSDPISSLVSSVPEVVDKISDFIKKKKDNSDENQ